jgi:predicted phosphodiesterase
VRDGGVWLLNPGSPTERRRAPARAMLLVHAEAGALVPEPVVLT